MRGEAREKDEGNKYKNNNNNKMALALQCVKWPESHNTRARWERNPTRSGMAATMTTMRGDKKVHPPYCRDNESD